ncbi:MAG: GAF domain-containing sensor histidine kinase [Anaerolineales bacterium]
MSAAQIFVVDDEPGITLLCERLLTRAGFRVTTFTDPRAALAQLEKERADLLLVDIRMPEISGLDLVQLARQRQPEIALLAMTGYGTVETAIQALRRGVDGLILKPFEKNELVSAVRQALADSQQKRDTARMQALRPLFDITEALFSETRPEALLDLIIGTVLRQLNSSSVAYYKFSPRENDLLTLAMRGRKAPEGLIRRVSAAEKPLLATSDPDAERELAEAGLSSALIVPTALADSRFVLFAGRESGEAPFREADMEMFFILARQAALAMENARLYEELRAYIRRVEESQQALIQAEKLAAAGRLTASIAHEINNPLQSVRNCLHLATREDAPPEMRQQYLDLTRQELDRLMNTVQRMLDFYRPSAEFRPVQILDLLEHVINLLGSQLRERNISISTEWPAALPAIQAISNQLEQVFINILLNAFDAMPNGGAILVSITQKRKWVEITFQDNGPGVPAALRESIFEPFITTKGGTGLGLSISYDIVTAHGGQLDCIAKAQPGACFRLRLPIKENREMKSA